MLLIFRAWVLRQHFRINFGLRSGHGSRLSEVINNCQMHIFCTGAGHNLKSGKAAQLKVRVAIPTHEIKRILWLARPSVFRFSVEDISKVGFRSEAQQHFGIGTSEPMLHRKCGELIVNVTVEDDYAADFGACLSNGAPKANQIQHIKDRSPEK